MRRALGQGGPTRKGANGRESRILADGATVEKGSGPPKLVCHMAGEQFSAVGSNVHWIGQLVQWRGSGSSAIPGDCGGSFALPKSRSAQSLHPYDTLDRDVQEGPGDRGTICRSKSAAAAAKSP